MASRYLDLVEEVCPVPLLRIQEALRGAQPGEAVVARLGYARSVRNVMEWAEREGVSFTVDELPGGVWELTLCRQAGGSGGWRRA